LSLLCKEATNFDRTLKPYINGPFPELNLSSQTFFQNRYSTTRENFVEKCSDAGIAGGPMQALCCTQIKRTRKTRFPGDKNTITPPQSLTRDENARIHGDDLVAREPTSRRAQAMAVARALDFIGQKIQKMCLVHNSRLLEKIFCAKLVAASHGQVEK